MDPSEIFKLDDRKSRFELSWNNLSVCKSKKSSSSFWKRDGNEDVQILNDVSGRVKSGDLLAIMGPSGSGKTTLLASISMRIHGNFSGSIEFNGQLVSKQYLTSISGFVPQYDITFEMLTVTEHMEFMTKMKMNKHTKTSARKRRIEHLLNTLGLNKCQYTELRSLSGGERKRLSLAVQLINDPPILFCDEPTTGLDSWTAMSVIDQLRNLSSEGRAIVCSIHQPASGIIDLFHQVLLLTGGRVAFHGPVKEATAFFRSQGLVPPNGYNEAEFLVSMISNDERAAKICSAWESISRNNIENNNSFNDFDTIKKNENHTYKYLAETPGILTQLYWLMWRSHLCSKRNYKIWFGELLSLLGIGLIVALPYVGILNDPSQRDVQSIQGLLYLVVAEVVFTFVYSVFHAFPPEIAILLRELANELYTPAPYYFSKIVLMIPGAVLQSFLYTSVIYWIVGLGSEFSVWITFTIPIIFAANCANAYGSWLSATFESIATASMASVPIELVSYTFSGTFLNLATASLYWLKYLSIFYYPTEAISIVQWRGIQKIRCDVEKGSPCATTGAEVVDYFGFNIANYLFDLCGMIAIYIVFHFFGYLSICRRSKRQPVY